MYIYPHIYISMYLCICKNICMYMCASFHLSQSSQEDSVRNTQTTSTSLLDQKRRPENHLVAHSPTIRYLPFFHFHSSKPECCGSRMVAEPLAPALVGQH